MSAMPDALASLLATTRLKHFPRGQIVLYADDAPAEVFILQNGIVKVHDVDDQGNEKVLHIMKPPAVMPLIMLQQGEDIVPWFYTALVDCDMYVLPRAQLAEEMEHDSSLALYLMRWFGSEAHELLVRLSSMGKTNTRDKLIAALKFLSVCHSLLRRSGWRRVTFPVNHQLLADMIGVTRESTAVSMKELQDEGVVRYPRLTMLEIHFNRLLEA